jgi:hypothetical protein
MDAGCSGDPVPGTQHLEREQDEGIERAAIGCEFASHADAG